MTVRLEEKTQGWIEILKVSDHYDCTIGIIIFGGKLVNPATFSTYFTLIYISKCSLMIFAAFQVV